MEGMMRRSWGVKTGWSSLLLAMLAITVGCKGGGDKDEEEEAERRFQIRGSYFRVSHYTQTSEALYLDAFVNSDSKHGGTNLARWERQGMNRPMPPGALDKFKAPGGTGYLTAGAPYGAADPDVDVLFLIEREPGLTLYTRKPAGGQVAPSELSGAYSCVRHLTQPTSQLQWFQADFVQDGVFQYSLDGENPLVARYELQENGRFRILEDQGLTIPDSAIGASEEALLEGGFQNQQQFLMASYMIGSKEPDLSGSLPENQTTKAPERVTTHGLLLCLKGDHRLTEANLQGQYWFAQLQLRAGQSDVNTFGYITADGQGSLQRKECKLSSGTPRDIPSAYHVNTEDYAGSLTLDELKMKGVLSVDGEMALLVSSDPNVQTIDILLKKYREGGCPG